MWEGEDDGASATTIDPFIIPEKRCDVDDVVAYVCAKAASDETYDCVRRCNNATAACDAGSACFQCAQYESLTLWGKPLSDELYTTDIGMESDPQSRYTSYKSLSSWAFNTGNTGEDSDASFHLYQQFTERDPPDLRGCTHDQLVAMTTALGCCYEATSGHCLEKFYALHNTVACAPGCLNDYLGDDVCDCNCYNEACNFDKGDCNRYDADSIAGRCQGYGYRDVVERCPGATDITTRFYDHSPTPSPTRRPTTRKPTRSPASSTPKPTAKPTTRSPASQPTTPTPTRRPTPKPTRRPTYYY